MRMRGMAREATTRELLCGAAVHVSRSERDDEGHDVAEFVERFNREWHVEELSYMTPAAARSGEMATAA